MTDLPAAGAVRATAALTRQVPGPATPDPSESLPRSAKNADPCTLSTGEALEVLGLTRCDLDGLVDAGWLRPAGQPGDRRWPLDQIQALRNIRAPDGRSDLRPRYLRALGDLLTESGWRCLVRRRDGHPYLLARSPAGAKTTVWLVRISTGWRFLWQRYRSHPACDLPGTAAAIMNTAGPAPAGARHTADLSSLARRRALRRLAREQPAAYTALYRRIRPGTPSHRHARGLAWTKLRYQYPDRYQELYAEECGSAADAAVGLTNARSGQTAGHDQ